MKLRRLISYGKKKRRGEEQQQQQQQQHAQEQVDGPLEVVQQTGDAFETVSVDGTRDDAPATEEIIFAHNESQEVLAEEAAALFLDRKKRISSFQVSSHPPNQVPMKPARSLSLASPSALEGRRRSFGNLLRRSSGSIPFVSNNSSNKRNPTSYSEEETWTPPASTVPTRAATTKSPKPLETFAPVIVPRGSDPPGHGSEVLCGQTVESADDTLELNLVANMDIFSVTADSAIEHGTPATGAREDKTLSEKGPVVKSMIKSLTKQETSKDKLNATSQRAEPNSPKALSPSPPRAPPATRKPKALQEAPVQLEKSPLGPDRNSMIIECPEGVDEYSLITEPAFASPPRGSRDPYNMKGAPRRSFIDQLSEYAPLFFGDDFDATLMDEQPTLAATLSTEDSQNEIQLTETFDVITMGSDLWASDTLHDRESNLVSAYPKKQGLVQNMWSCGPGMLSNMLSCSSTPKREKEEVTMTFYNEAPSGSFGAFSLFDD